MSVRTETEQRRSRIYARGLTVSKSPIDGKGCFSTMFFPRGSWIAKYEGEQVTREEGIRRLRRQRKKRVSAINANWSIDGSVGGNGAEYINHSCDPACLPLILDGQIHIFALRDIQPGEELTVDYLDMDDFRLRECHCGSAYCRGRWQPESQGKVKL